MTDSQPASESSADHGQASDSDPFDVAGIPFPRKPFADTHSYYQTTKPSLTLIVKREIVGPVIVRNSTAEKAETQQFDTGDDTDQPFLTAQANGEKFRSKERNTGIERLRALDNTFDGEIDLIHDEYRYNEVASLEEAVNLDIVTYGGVDTQSRDSFQFTSRAIEPYTYTVEPYSMDPDDSEKRNSVYESGTMQDRDGRQSTSLYELRPVSPSNAFLHFITLTTGHPAMLLYVLHNLLNTDMYGARTAITGRNIRNNILGLIVATEEATLSTGEYLAEYHTAHETLERNIADYLTDVTTINPDADLPVSVTTNTPGTRDWDIYGDPLQHDDTDAIEPFPEWFLAACAVAGREHPDADARLYDAFSSFTAELHDTYLDDA